MANRKTYDELEKENKEMVEVFQLIWNEEDIDKHPSLEPHRASLVCYANIRRLVDDLLTKLDGHDG